VHASKILPMSKTRTSSARSRSTWSTTAGDPATTRCRASSTCSRASTWPRPGRHGPRSWPRCPLNERLQRRIIDGERNGLEADLDEALTDRPALAIINDTLLAGMKTVGELFGSGQMQLPFVLQSAEVMKTAVAYLEPHMEKADDGGKGRIVLATVKGDVHDIGKNLVDIILTNNGYEVVNIGIKQPITAILDAAEENNADAIGMSGLLVKSTVIMKENLQEMDARGVSTRCRCCWAGPR
jgi:5-methyltetrahydrofolate--homocysteine methyltransferase